MLPGAGLQEAYTKHEWPVPAAVHYYQNGHRSKKTCENIVKAAQFCTPDGPGAPPGRVVQAPGEPSRGAGRGVQAIQAPSTTFKHFQKGTEANPLFKLL